MLGSAQVKILLIFILTSILAGLSILLIGGQYANEVVVLKNLLISIYYFVALWLFYERFNNYGLAFLGTILLFILLGFLAVVVPFILILIPLVILLTYRISFYKIERSSTLVIDLFLLLAISLILALIAISGTRGAAGGWSYIDFFVDHKVINARVVKDPFFHAAIANMFKNYQMPMSVGLHGVSLQTPYYTFSHFLYGLIASGLGITTMQVYGHSTFILFIPLLFLSILSLSEELSPSRNKLGLYILFLMLISVFIGFFGYENFDRYSLLHYYFVSESYLVSLSLLLAFLSYRLSSNVKFDIWISALFLFLLFVTKSSTGLMAFLFLIIQELSDLKRPRISVINNEHKLSGLMTQGKLLLRNNSHILLRTIFYIFVGAGSFFLVTPSSIEGATTFRFLDFYIKGYCSGNFWLCFFVHYFFVWLAGLVLLIYYFLDKNKFHRFKLLFLASVLVSIIGFIPHSMTLPGAGAYFFSNIGMFMALPMVLSIKDDVPRKIFLAEGQNRLAYVFLGICLFGVSGSFYYGPLYLKNTIQEIQTETSWAEVVTPATGYIKQLQRISQDHTTQNYLVYIAKEEADFWETDPDCTKTPFFIPAISERPALFGLPSKTCGQQPIYFGYQAYSQALFEESSLARISPKRLCQEILALGFEGYLEVSAFSYEPVDCTVSRTPTERPALTEFIVNQTWDGWILLGYVVDEARLLSNEPVDLTLYWLALPGTEPVASEDFYHQGNNLWVQTVRQIQNLIPDGSFEKQPRVANFFADDIYKAAPETRQLIDDVREGQPTTVATLKNTAAFKNTSFASEQIPVDHNKFYLQAGWLKSEAGNSYLGRRWLPTGKYNYAASAVTPPKWAHYAQVIKPPDGAATAQIWLLNYESTGQAYFDNLVFVEIGDLSHLN